MKYLGTLEHPLAKMIIENTKILQYGILVRPHRSRLRYAFGDIEPVQFCEFELLLIEYGLCCYILPGVSVTVERVLLLLAVLFSFGLVLFCCWAIKLPLFGSVMISTKATEMADSPTK